MGVDNVTDLLVEPAFDTLYNKLTATQESYLESKLPNGARVDTTTLQGPRYNSLVLTNDVPLASSPYQKNALVNELFTYLQPLDIRLITSFTGNVVKDAMWRGTLSYAPSTNLQGIAEFAQATTLAPAENDFLNQTINNFFAQKQRRPSMRSLFVLSQEDAARAKNVLDFTHIYDEATKTTQLR